MIDPTKIKQIEGATYYVVEEPTSEEISQFPLPVNFKIVNAESGTYKIVSYKADGTRLELASSNLEVGMTPDGDLSNGSEIILENAKVLSFSENHFDYEFDEDNETVMIKSKGGGGGSPAVIYEQVTKEDLDALISDSDLLIGALYEIIDADKNLYGGTTIWLKALTTNTLEKQGTGEFFVPNYIDNFNGYNTFDAAIDYTPGEMIIYGGFYWIKQIVGISAPIDNFNLSDEYWLKCNYEYEDESGRLYITNYDIIEYDLVHDAITYRKDCFKNVVEFDFMWYDQYERNAQPYPPDMTNPQFNPIKCFKWIPFDNDIDPMFFEAE